MTLNADSAGVEQPVGWPRRFTIILFFFTCTLILYIDRVSISVVAPVLTKEFGWDEAMMGTILSAFFVGYLFTQLPGGLIADRFGGKGILGFAVLWWSALTFITPFARTVPLMIAARIGLGIGEGVTQPALYSMTARWIPARERSRVIAFNLAGVYLGLMIAFPVAVWLMTTWGWPWVFYTFGLLGIVWAVLWYFLVTSRPEDHPTISPAELVYIQQDRPQADPVETFPGDYFSRPAHFGLC